MKKTATEQQMRQIILERARMLPECKDVASVGIYHVVEPGRPNWEISVVQNVPDSLGYLAISRNAQDLAAEYDVQWPAESFDLTVGATVFAEGAQPGVAEPVFGATLREAIHWARGQKPEVKYSVWFHEPGSAPRPLMLEELDWLFRKVP
jgi:hypothetical protein